MGTTGQSITLANSIIGVGILAMPFCFQQCGVLLATLILLTMGLVSRLCCYFLLKSALLARRRNFEFLAFHVFGPAGKLAVEVGIIGFLMGTCIAYFVVVGDLGPQIIAKMFNINQSDILRTSIMVIVSLVCVLPLGLLRNVDSLSNVSAATIGFYFCLVMKVLAEATSQAFAPDLHTRVEMWRPAGVLQCVPIFSMALFCQTQLFEIFESLPTLSLEKMNVVTKNAINICTGVYFTLGLFGYIAFSSQKISGNILMSLSPTMASDVIKLGFVMSVAFSFPLIIFPCRASLYSFLYKKVHSSQHDHIINNSIPESTFRCITVAIIAVALFVSLLLPNIELVLGLVGSTIGVLVCLVFPAACFLNLTTKNTNDRVLAKAILILGLLIMVLGTYANLQAAESAPDKYDERATQDRIDKMLEDFFKDKNEQAINLSKDHPAIQKDNKELLKEVNVEQVKDSEVQPPNPVPPESQSNEVKKPIEVVPDKVEKKIENDPDKLPIDEADKVSESHPKNLKNKLNGINKENEVNKVEEKKEEPPKQKDVVDKTQEKADLIKQQQLIETIKQHGEEQKELIKEQKEILQKIIKTKNELKEKKIEVDSNEAKKIAVESIQKIANVAIQSLSGVSDKPIANDGEKKSEPLEKIANEAVQEIAKKVVETMEAIKEIKEQPQPIEPKIETKNQNVQAQANPVPARNILSNPNIEPKESNNQINTNNVNQQVPQNLPQVNAQQNVIPPKNDAAINNQPIANGNKQEIPPAIPVNNVQSNINQLEANDNRHNNAPVINAPVVNIPTNLVQNQGNVINNNVPLENPPNNAPVDQKQINQNPVNNIEPKAQEIKQHSHKPDEPQSYKQGEDDTYKKNIEEFNKNMAQNVPIPIAMNGHNKLKQDTQQNEGAKLDSNINVDTNAQNDANINNLPENHRQKREVVDCTEKSILKPADREICDTLVNPSVVKVSEQDVLQPVDLNYVLQKRGVPGDEIVHLRSLKSIQKKR